MKQKIQLFKDQKSENYQEKNLKKNGRKGAQKNKLIDTQLLLKSLLHSDDVIVVYEG